MEHTVEVYPAWAEHRRDLQEAIGGGDLSRTALAEAMVRGGGGRRPATEDAGLRTVSSG